MNFENIMRFVSGNIEIVFEYINAKWLVGASTETLNDFPSTSVERKTFDQLSLGIRPIQPAIGPIDGQSRRTQQIF